MGRRLEVRGSGAADAGVLRIPVFIEGELAPTIAFNIMGHHKIAFNK
jgi:hypothetical protein